MTPIETPHRGLRTRNDPSIYEKATLSNGITVWTQRASTLLSEEGVIVAYFVNVGNVLDPVGKEGLAHFLEHMPFKGTAKYPDNATLTEAASSRGGSMNATTSSYTTKYFVSTPGNDFPVALDILCELLLAPAMREADFEIERGVIESERQRQFEHGKALANHDVDMLLFGNHPAMTWGIGSAESIASIRLDDVKAFWDEHYHAGNLHLVVGGTFSEQPDLLKQLEEVFGSMTRKPTLQLSLPALPVPEPGRKRIVDTRYGRNRFYLEWVVPGIPDVSSLNALALLNSAFAGGMDSPLALELRDKRGLVYESGLMHGGRVNKLATISGIELPISAESFEEVHPVVMQTLAEISDERIARVLDRWQLARLSQFSNPVGACLSVGGELVIHGEPKTLHDRESELDDIDLDLVHWWRDFLVKTPPAIVETSQTGDTA